MFGRRIFSGDISRIFMGICFWLHCHNLGWDYTFTDVVRKGEKRNQGGLKQNRGAKK